VRTGESNRKEPSTNRGIVKVLLVRRYRTKASASNKGPPFHLCTAAADRRGPKHSFGRFPKRSVRGSSKLRLHPLLVGTATFDEI